MTATETLIEILEKFSHDEPEAILVVWISEGGYVNFKSNCGNTLAVGLARVAEQNVMKAILDSDD